MSTISKQDSRDRLSLVILEDNGQVHVSPEVVIQIMRERFSIVMWEMTLLEARCRQAEKQVAEMTEKLSKDG